VLSLIAQSMIHPSDRLDRPRGTVDAFAVAMPVALVAIGYAIALALADHLPHVKSLLPIVNTIAFSGGAVAYYLLKVRARANDDDRLRWMASGYGIATVAVALQTLGFPGVLPNGGPLGTGSSGAAMLYLAWHLVVPLFAIGAVVLPHRHRVRTVGAIACFLAILVIAWEPSFLPDVADAAGQYTTPFRIVLAATALGSLIVTIVWSVTAGRYPSWTFAWITVSLALGTWDAVLHAIATERFAIYWWASLALRLAQFSVLAAGLLGGFVALFRTLDRTNEELDAANQELEDATRHKSEFLSRTSHELRTPMNAIIGYSSLLLDGLAGDLTPRQTADVEQISVSAHRLLDLINDVLDLSKIEAGRLDLAPEPVAIGDIVHRVCNEIRPLADQKGLGLTVDLAANIPMVEVDIQRMHQILLNLVGNAVKFTDVGGVRVTARRRADHVEVAIADSGIGIAPEDIPHIFDEFRQADGSTSRRFGGTGLGLAIAKKLTELHHGSLAVTSQPGAGSVFTLHLPIERGALASATVTPRFVTVSA